MENKTEKKVPLHTEINDLLNEFGESVETAAQNSLFRQQVAKEILDLFSPEGKSAFAQDTTRAILESFQKGALDKEDIYLIRDFMVEWKTHTEKQEEGLGMHEVIGIVLKAGKAGESISDAAKELLKKHVVEEDVLVGYQ